MQKFQIQISNERSFPIAIQLVQQNTLFRNHTDAWRLQGLVVALRCERMEHETRVMARSGAMKLAADLLLSMMERGRTEWCYAIIS